jgi:DNA-binding GntR family transcriptional regulator
MILADLAKAFGASPTPVREAIRRLESDGYVQFTPHVGAVVTGIDDRKFFEINLIRVALEHLATRLAVPYLKERDFAFLRKKNGEMEAAIEQSHYGRLPRLNKAFHLRIYKAAPYPYLYKMISDLWDAFENWPSVFTFVPERAAQSVQEHREIIAALVKGDMDQADSLMKINQERALRALQNYMEQVKNPSPGRSGK